MRKDRLMDKEREKGQSVRRAMVTSARTALSLSMDSMSFFSLKEALTPSIPSPSIMSIVAAVTDDEATAVVDPDDR